MKAADKIVFNRLVSHGGINLPGVGSLRMEFRRAELAGKKLIPPGTRVIFSRREIPGLPDMPSLIAAEAATDHESARNIYDNWLKTAQNGTELHIEGVGDIRQDFFTPAPALSALLNPVPAEEIRIAPRRKTAWIILAPLPVIAGCAAAVLFFGEDLNLPSLNFNKQSKSPQQEIPSANTVPDKLPDANITISGDSLKNPVQDSLPPDREEPGTTPRASAPDGLYHIVAGVYSTEENADKFIAKARLKADTLPYSKVRMPNGKIVVSVYSSSDQTQTERRKEQLIKSDPSLWIYKSK